MVEQNASNLYWHEGEVTRIDRAKLLQQQGATLWLTGLSGSGKSTIAVALEQALLQRGKLAYRLDGDNIRMGINKNLGFSEADRTENIRRIGEVSKLFADAGLLVLNSFISPYIADRTAVRDLHQKSDLPFIEIYINCSLNVAEQRDPKGLYKKVRAGEIKQFTGIDAPYEAPTHAELNIDTTSLTLEQEVQIIIDYLIKQGLLNT